MYGMNIKINTDIDYLCTSPMIATVISHFPQHNSMIGLHERDLCVCVKQELAIFQVLTVTVLKIHSSGNITAQCNIPDVNLQQPQISHCTNSVDQAEQEQHHTCSKLTHPREETVSVSINYTSLHKVLFLNQGIIPLTFRHRASSTQDRRFATLQRTLFIYLINKYISLSDICLKVHH